MVGALTKMQESRSVSLDTPQRHTPALVGSDEAEHMRVGGPSSLVWDEVRGTGATGLVCAAVAILVFCGQISLSGVVSFIPPAVRQALLPLYSPVAHTLLLLALCKSRRCWSVAGACAVVGVVIALCLPYFREGLVSEFVTLALIILALCEADVKLVVCTFFWAILAALTVIVVVDALCLSSSVWFNPNGYWVYSYGTGHPNTFGALLYGTVTALVLAIDRDRYRLPLLVCCAATTLFTFFALSCRSAAVLELVLMLALIVEEVFPNWMKRVEASGILNALVAVGTVVLGLLMLAGTKWYGSADGLFGLVDRLTNARVSNGHVAYQSLGGFTLFGREVVFSSRHASFMQGIPYLLIDSAYSRFGLVYGLVPGVCLLVLFCRVAYVSAGKGGTGLLWAILGLNSLYCAIERYPLLVIWNGVLSVLAWGVVSRAEMRGACERSTRAPSSASGCGSASPRFVRVAHGLGIAFYCVLLGFLTFQAATNGTGATDMSAEFPRSVRVLCSDGLIAENVRGATGIAANSTASGALQIAQAEFSEGEQVGGQVFGSNVGGSIQKSDTRGDAIRYFMPLVKEDAEQEPYGLYFLAPGRGVPGSQLGRWAVCVMDYTSGEPRRASVWLELGEDGRATFGSGKLDATAAEASDLKSRERKGAWSTTDRDGATYVRCFFGDEWLEIAMEERGG